MFSIESKICGIYSFLTGKEEKEKKKKILLHYVIREKIVCGAFKWSYAAWNTFKFISIIEVEPTCLLGYIKESLHYDLRRRSFALHFNAVTNYIWNKI